MFYLERQIHLTAMRHAIASLSLLFGSLLLAACVNQKTLMVNGQNSEITFAVIGDFGLEGEDEARVAARVDGWNPDFIITVGDNNYPDGEAETIDANIGQYYNAYIGNYIGKYGSGDAPDRPNNFYPSLGNHDYKVVAGTDLPPKPYLDYFALPGNERYYHFRRGPLEFFVINSNSEEPDGTSADSIQGKWLKQQLAASTADWNIVYMHHAPFSSRKVGGSSKQMRWPYKKWGADVVLSGHDHTYERIERDGMLYIVNGLGGSSIYLKGAALKGSLIQYNEKHAAMRVVANARSMVFQLISHDGDLIDEYILTK